LLSHVTFNSSLIIANLTLIEIVWLLWSVAALAAFWYGTGSRAPRWFRRYPAPGALVSAVVLISGWTLLPVLNLETFGSAAQTRDWFDTIRGTAMVQPIIWTKAFIIGGVTLLGIWLFDYQRLRQIRWRWLDGLLALWCLMPAVSALSNDLGMTTALHNSFYQTVVWGGPYLAGRIYLADGPGRRAFAQVLVAAGLLYVPLCLIEIATSPILYDTVYGHHWYRMDGANRWIGFRPIVFLAHGNALGIWMASVAIVGFTAYQCGVLALWPRWLRWMGGVGLPIVAVLCQSVGPIILLLLALSVFVLARWLKRWVLMTALMLPVIGAVGLRIADPIHAQPALRAIGGHSLVSWVKQLPKAKSLGWRIDEQERQMAAVRAAPMLGHGKWDWWRERVPAPWGLGMLVLGQHGLLGVMVMLSCFLGPIGYFLWRLPPPNWFSHGHAYVHAGLAAALTISFLDLGLNSFFALPLFALTPALIAAPHQRQDH
jgi:hypothetical protein